MNSVQMLLKLLDDLEETNFSYQKLCQIRKSLFKPWHTDTGTVKPEKDSVNVKQTDSEDDLTSVEQEELRRMDKVLSRAQKTLAVKNKVKESKFSRLPGLEFSRSTEIDVDDQSHETETQEESAHPDNARINNSQNLSHKTSSSLLSSSSFTKKKLISEDKLSCNDKTSKSFVIPESSVITQSKLDKLISRETRIIKPKVKPSRVVPAHVNAPFKTNPFIPVPNRKTNEKIKSATRQRPHSGTQRNTKHAIVKNANYLIKDQNRKSQSATTTKKENDNSQKNIEHLDLVETKEERLTNSNDCDTLTAQTSSSQSLLPTTMVTETRAEVKSERKPESSVLDNIEYQVKHVQISSEPMIKKEDNRFCLQTDGAKLKLPSKLRRYYALNARLKQKIFTQKLTKKVDTCSSRQNFLSRLEETFERTEVMHVGKKVKNMEIVYTKLFHLLNSMALDQISGSSSCYEIMRAKKLLELLLTTFYQTEEGRLQTNIEILETIPRDQFCVIDIAPPKPDYTSLSWLPRTVLTDTRIREHLSNPSVLHYHSGQEVDKYISLTFQVQFLQLHITLLEVIAKEMLPLLSNSDVNNRDTVRILRSLYFILISNETFPVIVKDTRQELEDSVMEDTHT